MSRLSLELQRLYLPPGPAAAGGWQLPAADGSLRGLVLELHAPADWSALARVWQGVQADLALPAPGIAVSGQDGFQLWFSLALPVPATEAAGFLAALCRRYLADMPAHRLRLLPGTPGWHPAAVPAAQADGGPWSAFIAQDLAPVFSETPWLDTPPNPDGQAGLLATLRSMQPADFRQALETLGLCAPVPGPLPVAPAATPAESAPPVAPTLSAAPPPAGHTADARQFLLTVMNDAAVPMALRIDAAKALLAAPPG